MLKLKHAIHQTPEWLTTYSEYFQPEVLSILLPHHNSYYKKLYFQINHSPCTRFLSMREIVPLAEGPSDFFDIPCLYGYEEEAANTIANWLVEHSELWDSMKLGLIPESSPSWKPLVNALSAQGFSPVVGRSEVFYYLDTSGSWEEYANIYWRRKKRLMKKFHRVERDGYKLEFITIRENVNNYLNVLFNLYAKRRESKDQYNTFADPTWQSFLYAVIQKFEENNMVNIMLIKDQNQEIWAIDLNWFMNNIEYGYSFAFNEKFKKYSPGKILVYNILKDAFLDPAISEFNFMRGGSVYKSEFTNQYESYISIEIQNPHSFRIILQKLVNIIIDIRKRILN